MAETLSRRSFDFLVSDPEFNVTRHDTHFEPPQISRSFEHQFPEALNTNSLRHAEFGRAIAKMWTKNKGLVRYVGVLREDQKEVRADISAMIYGWWDESESAPPKRRPQDETQALPRMEDVAGQLQLLAFHEGRPRWPETLLAKFPEGTTEREHLLEMKSNFEAKYPAPRGPTRRASSASVGSASVRHEAAGTAVPRASGECDYSVDSEPLDVRRMIDMPFVTARDFSEKRLSMSM